MFFANVSIAEKYDYLDEKFRAAYKWLRETDIKSLPEGSYPILGDAAGGQLSDSGRRGRSQCAGIYHFSERREKL